MWMYKRASKRIGINLHMKVCTAYMWIHVDVHYMPVCWYKYLVGIDQRLKNQQQKEVLPPGEIS